MDLQSIARTNGRHLAKRSTTTRGTGGPLAEKRSNEEIYDDLVAHFRSLPPGTVIGGPW